MTEFVMVMTKRAADCYETGLWPVGVGCVDISCSVMADNGDRRVPVVELAN
ncbi:hypothetical protein Dd1591_0612 [Dickeya chrysanthemi Ech1591]|uniref:Uncharacterized protein n=1 Tax=Dickeya chrysanthemi (strain Ech1591) TaxID=561229 RepID=C6CJX6_DICC1|nr:hypothetical protein Dd1591_0612 [Dickeya chrysanthemi Ech1591]